MEADWSVEAGGEDAVLVVPWSADSDCTFVDLRTHPERMGEVTETKKWPELRRALLALNAPAAPVWTAMCDAWELDGEERARVASVLEEQDASCGIGSYIDVLLAQTISDFEPYERWARSIAQSAADLPLPQVEADMVIRPAVVYGQAGFALTAYLYAIAPTMVGARVQWSKGLVWLSHALESQAPQTAQARMRERASSSIG